MMMDENPVLEEIRRQLINNLLTVPYPLIYDLDKYYYIEDEDMKNDEVFVNGCKVDNCKIVYENNKVSISYDEKFDLWDIVDNRLDDLVDELESLFSKEQGYNVSFDDYDIDDVNLSVSFIVENEKWSFNRQFISRVLDIPLQNVLAHELNGEWIYTIILKKPDED